MFFFFLSFISSEMDQRCKPIIKHAEVIPNMSLTYIQVLTRHGMRTPIEILLDQDRRGEWNCNPPNFLASRTSTSPSHHYRRVHHVIDERLIAYPPTCGNGDLTVEGMNQHYELGQLYRNYLVDQIHLLPEKYDRNIFDFVSSPVDRCFRSAESFLFGLYNPEDQNEVIPIQTGSSSISSLVVPGEKCVEATEYMYNFRHGPKYEAFINETWDILKEGINFFNLPRSFEGYDKYCSWVISFMCNENAQLPAFVTEDVKKQCFKVGAFNQYGSFRQADSPGLMASTVVRQAMKITDDAINGGEGKKFALLSAHDTSVAAYLTLLGYTNNDNPPPYASHLAMEIWKQDKTGELYVRYVFNGEPVELTGFQNETVVRFDLFRSYIAPLIDHCN